jgi:hypothetical protein
MVGRFACAARLEVCAGGSAAPEFSAKTNNQVRIEVKFRIILGARFPGLPKWVAEPGPIVLWSAHFPASITGLPVTTIGDFAFDSKSSLTGITNRKGVKESLAYQERAAYLLLRRGVPVASFLSLSESIV